MKRMLSIALLLALLCGFFGGGAAAFIDISDLSEQFAATALQSMGIMEGVGGGLFQPNAILTRGQFAKLATLARGFSELQVYRNYTIFSDVRNTEWYAPYVNAAVRKYQILQGFPDGTYRPNEPVTYGQALTILVNLLGYTVADVGPFWPADYIAKADALGLTDGVSLSANDPIPRGKAAILLCNLLLADTKEGGSFLSSSFSTVYSDVVLLATYESDPAIAEGKASFQSGGQQMTLSLSRPIPVSLVGSRGYLVLEDTSQNSVLGFMPDTRGATQGVVVRSHADRLVLEDGTYPIPRDASLCVGGVLTPYAEGWFDLNAGDTVNLFYSEDGAIELVSGLSAIAVRDTFIYGVDRGASVPDGAKIIKNGAEAQTSALRKYDVVSIDSTRNICYVSDRRLKGIYEDASPAYAYPSTVTVFGNTFGVPEQAAASFASMRPGDTVVLLFDVNGNVAGALKGSALSFDQVGLMTDFSESSVSIDLLSDVTVSGKPSLSGYRTFPTYSSGNISTLALSEGQLVRVSQDNGDSVTVAPIRYDAPGGHWDLAAGMIGKTPVSPKAVIYEQVASTAPLNRISPADIPVDVVPAAKILHADTGASGAVETIILGDVTGLGWEYGLLSSKTETETSSSSLGDISNTFYTYTLQTSSGSQSYTLSLRSGSFGSGVPGALPRGIGSLSYFRSLPTLALERAATVRNEHFNGAKSVTVDGGTIPISEDVQVFTKTGKTALTLGAARANFESFELYLDRPVSDGGSCVIILAS